MNPERPLAALESGVVPWGGLAGREAALWLERRWRLEPAAAGAPLLAQLGHYPLDPWRWLLYARIHWASSDDAQALRRNLSAAISVQPHNRELRWQAANLAQSTGNTDLVLDHLALWLADNARDTARALFVAGRWADGPETLLDRVVPDDESFLAEAMAYARRSHDVALAQAVWQRLDRPREPTEETFAAYVSTALNNQRPDLAMQAWQRVDADYRPGDVPAGDFAMPLEALPAFGWELYVPEGTALERVALADTDVGAISRSRVAGPTADRGLEAAPTGDPDVGAISRSRSAPGHALHLSFDGEQNIHLATPYVRFPVHEPGRYRLSGWWRAEGLTTRSLPYVQLYAESSEHRFSESRPVPGPDFAWQRFQIPFEVIAQDEIFRFRLRRDRTDAFDRYISGSVWVAGLRVEEVGRKVGESEGGE